MMVHADLFLPLLILGEFFYILTFILSIITIYIYIIIYIMFNKINICSFCFYLFVLFNKINICSFCLFCSHFTAFASSFATFLGYFFILLRIGIHLALDAPEEAFRKRGHLEKFPAHCVEEYRLAYLVLDIIGKPIHILLPLRIHNETALILTRCHDTDIFLQPCENHQTNGTPHNGTPPWR